MLQGNHCVWPIKLRPICGGRKRSGEKKKVFLLSSSGIPLKSGYSMRPDKEQDEAEVWH